MTDFCKGDIEQMKPKLVQGVKINKFAPDINFVEFDGRYIKMDDADNQLLSEFDGSSTLADVIAKYLAKGDTGVFNRVLSLITRLNKADLFDKECASVLKDQKKIDTPFFYHEKKVGTIHPKGLYAFKGKVMTSVFGLILLAVFSATALYAPSLKGLNILKELTGGVVSPGYAYFAAIVFIWILVSAILSIISISSGAALAGLGLAVPVSIVFRYGLFFLSVKSVSVISAGRKEAVKHYIMLMLIPFSIAGITAALQYSGIFSPVLTIIYVVSLSIGLWRVSPLLKTPFTVFSSFFVAGEGSTATFLRRRFVKNLLTTKKNSTETDRLILLSTFGIMWLYAVYEYFWYVANSTLSYLLADAVAEDGTTFVLIAISLLIIVIPVLLIATGTLIVVLENIGSVTATPIARMRRIADNITSKKVPAKAQIMDFLQQIPLFSGLDETERTALCSHIRLIRYGSKRRIIRQGDEGDCFYTIVSGEADVVIEDSSGRETIVETLSTGDSFGETALLEKVPRTASIIAKSAVAAFEIDRESFERFIVLSAGGKEKVTDIIRLSKLLISIPLFSFMNPRQISMVIMRLKTENISAGKMFFDQGDKGDKFYLIKKGTVNIKRTENEKSVLDRQLGDGDFFGEIALIKEVLRTAKAVAVSDCIVATLTKEEFLEIIGHSLFSGRELDSVMRQRASQLGKEALKSCL